MTGRCLLVVLLFTLSCCGHPQPEDLPSFPVEIDNAGDTILHTPNGGLIHISPHALTAGDDSRVRLVIRQNEDFIDIEAAKGQLVTFTKAIYIALPASTPAQNKWLYKGTRDPDGHLRFWKDPKAVFIYPPTKEFLHGKELFSNNCTACHNLQRKYEPDLLHGATQRHNRQWLLAFTRDNKKLRAAGDQYAIALYNQFNQTPMPAFPHLSDADIDDIHRYMDEYDFRRYPSFPDSLLQQHPNGFYQFTINEPGRYHIDTRPPSIKTYF